MEVLDDIQFHVMHCHHCGVEVPADYGRFASSWVEIPNSEFDPWRGHAILDGVGHLIFDESPQACAAGAAHADRVAAT